MTILRHQDHEAQVHVLGVQEGRRAAPAQFQTDNSHVTAAAKDAANAAGCQLWINTDLPLDGPEGRSFIKPSHMQPRVVQHGLVAATVKAQTLHATFVAMLAPSLSGQA
eukprot:163039-Alexandrium_andersonii.AAC.1